MHSTSGEVERVRASDSEENTYSPTESDALAPSLLNLMALMRRVGLPTI